MIQINFYKNKHNELYGYKVKNHGDSFICAAVSVLVINTANCIEHFTDAKVKVDHKETGGYFSFFVPSIKQGEPCPDASLLLRSFEFGIMGILKEYPRSIKISVISPKE